MNGREDWEKFAEREGITWEEGPPKWLDQYGTEYATLVWPTGDLAQFLRWSNIKPGQHVIVRMFPHTDGRGLTRMRFSSYSEKPKRVEDDA